MCQSVSLSGSHAVYSAQILSVVRPCADLESVRAGRLPPLAQVLSTYAHVALEVDSRMRFSRSENKAAVMHRVHAAPNLAQAVHNLVRRQRVAAAIGADSRRDVTGPITGSLLCLWPGRCSLNLCL